MNATDYLLSIGVNTGNSLDAADVVLTKFGFDGTISDLDALSEPMPSTLANRLCTFRKAAMDSAGNMAQAAKRYEQLVSEADLSSDTLDKVISDYTHYVANAVNKLKERFIQKNPDAKIDLIGFHGQTCAHQPPSIAKNPSETYTVQIGDGQQLANETNIAVVFDFRSDDIMNGGEGAPLVPVHHEHLAKHLKTEGKFPVAFCNAGNTGNISVISEHPIKGVMTFGWDVGPFNDYPDKLMQKEHNISCDQDGTIGSKGKISAELLKILFDQAAVTQQGENFLLKVPPKSSDPQWYKLLPELLGEKPVAGTILSFEDRLHTAEYFAAYIYYYSLRWISGELPITTNFALCGGGWNNPISRKHFEQLLQGEFDHAPILPEHKDIFSKINDRLKRQSKNNVIVGMSDDFGFSGQYMEARLFADAAFCRIKGEAFSRPETSGYRKPSILGIIRFPNKKKESATNKLQSLLEKYKSKDLTVDNPKLSLGKWSRATAGWSNHLASTSFK